MKNDPSKIMPRGGEFVSRWTANGKALRYTLDASKDNHADAVAVWVCDRDAAPLAEMTKSADAKEAINGRMFNSTFKGIALSVACGIELSQSFRAAAAERFNWGDRQAFLGAVVAEAKRLASLEAKSVKPSTARTSAPTQPAPRTAAARYLPSPEVVAAAEWQTMPYAEQQKYISDDVFIAARVRELKAERRPQPQPARIPTAARPEPSKPVPFSQQGLSPAAQAKAEWEAMDYATQDRYASEEIFVAARTRELKAESRSTPTTGRPTTADLHRQGFAARMERERNGNAQLNHAFAGV